MFDLFYIYHLDYTTKTVKYKIKIRRFFFSSDSQVYILFLLSFSQIFHLAFINVILPIKEPEVSVLRDCHSLNL